MAYLAVGTRTANVDDAAAVDINQLQYNFDALLDGSKDFADQGFESGAVLSFDSGDMLITHSSNALSITGGNFGIGGTPASAAGNAPFQVFSGATNNAIQITSTDPYAFLSMADDTTTAHGKVTVGAYGDGIVIQTGGVINMTMDSAGDAWFIGDVSALSFTDRTPFYEGDALSEIKKIKGKDGEIDHSTLPSFAHKVSKKDIFEDVEDKDGEITQVKVGEENVPLRDLGAMISMLTVAVQQIAERLEDLEKK